MSQEDVPASSHPRMGQPRVSFVGMEGLTGGRRQSGISDGGGGGKVNSSFTMDDNLEDPDTIQSVGISERNGVELRVLDREDSDPASKIQILKRRRVSVTPAGDAVIVRGADKSYESGTPVLNGLNMTVPCGSIYGLLGSSGCGKTTLLSCIVGQRRLDRGDIWIFGKKPGSKSIGVPGRNIGYQPQDVSLYLEFSIEETLVYFGTLAGMSKEQIESQISFLLNLLDLPLGSRKVATLSGGQQRRVSFGVALIHQPELLIADEPTVGVDPLMRQNIWIHLQKLVASKRTTVIITTHYIEECKQADNIGLMRSGRLLTERQPDELFAEYDSTNLEKIVLLLSRKDTEHKLDPKELAKAAANVKKQSKKWSLKRSRVNNDNVDAVEETTGPQSISSSEIENMGTKMASVMHEPEPALMDSFVRIKALTGKNFVILLRNPLLLFFVILIASVMLLIICLALGQDPLGLPIGLVNREVDYLAVCPNTTRTPGECDVENLSCHFLKYLAKDSVVLRVFDNEEDAVKATQTGAIWGLIMFPEDFSEKLFERMASGSNLDELTFNASQITVRLDETSKQISASLKKNLYDAYEDFIKIFLTDCGFDARQADSPLMYHDPLFGKDDTDFREFMAPGCIPALIFFYPIITTSIRYIKEKKNGVMDRSIVGGVQIWEIMVAYSISEFFVLVIQSLLSYAVFTHLFGITILGSHAICLLIFLLSGYGGVSMGFLLGSICTEEVQAAMIAMAAFFPNFILSGLVWPLEGMPEILQKIVQVFPCTSAAEAVRSVTSRGWEFTHPNVWPGVVILIAYIIGYFILTILFHKIFKR